MPVGLFKGRQANEKAVGIEFGHKKTELGFAVFAVCDIAGNFLYRPDALNTILFIYRHIINGCECLCDEVYWISEFRRRILRPEVQNGVSKHDNFPRVIRDHWPAGFRIYTCLSHAAQKQEAQEICRLYACGRVDYP